MKFLSLICQEGMESCALLPLPRPLSMEMLSSDTLGERQALKQMGPVGGKPASAWGTPFTHCDGQLALSRAQGLVDRAVDDSVRDDLDVTGYLAYPDPVLVAFEPQAVLLLLRTQSGGARKVGSVPGPPTPALVPASTHVDDQGEGLPGVVLDPLLPLGRGELRVREIVQAEPAVPPRLLGVQQLLSHSHLVGVGPSIDEEVHRCRCIAQGPRGRAGDEGGVENLAELVGKGQGQVEDGQTGMEKWGVGIEV